MALDRACAVAFSAEADHVCEGGGTPDHQKSLLAIERRGTAPTFTGHVARASLGLRLCCQRADAVAVGAGRLARRVSSAPTLFARAACSVSPLAGPSPMSPPRYSTLPTARTLKLIVSVGISGALAVTVYSPGARRATVRRVPSPSTGRHGRNRSNWPTACWARAAEANTINDWTLNGPKPDCEPNSSVLTGAREASNQLSGGHRPDSLSVTAAAGRGMRW